MGEGLEKKGDEWRRGFLEGVGVCFLLLLLLFEGEERGRFWRRGVVELLVDLGGRPRGKRSPVVVVDW